MKRAILAVGFLLLTVGASAQLAQDPVLAPLVGLWRVTYSFETNGNAASAGGREVVVMQPELTSLSWSAFSFQIGQKAGAADYGEITANVKKSGQGYALTFKLGTYAAVENMPLTYKADAGLSGTGSIKVNDKSVPAKASIVFDKTKMEHQWKIESLDGKVRYTLTFSKLKTTQKH